MNLTKLKRAGKIFLASLLISTVTCLAPVKVEADPKLDNKKPVIVMVDNVVQEAITGEYVLHNITKKGVDLVFNLKPNDLEDSKKVGSLRVLFEHNSKGVSFAIEAVKSEKRLEDKTLELSEYQRKFTKGFNSNGSSDYQLISKTLSTENLDSAAIKSMRQAGFKILISENKIKDGHILHDNGVMEIRRDPEGKIVKGGSKIKTIDELIKDIKKNLDPKNPFVITIDTKALLQKYGEKGMNSYIRELGNKLSLLREEGVEFQTFHELYFKHPQTVQYVMLRLDDYNAFWKRKSFQKVIDEIIFQNVPCTVAVIPKGLNDSFHAMKYLKNIKNAGVELAVHGYSHKDAELNKTLEEQTKILEKALKELEPVKPIRSVVPPLDAINNHTAEALQKVDKGLIIISANKAGDSYLFGFDNKGVYHISRTVDIVKKWEEPCQLKTYEKILSEIGDDDAVLMVHPQIHETKEHTEHLIGLVKKLKSNPKIKFVTLHDFYQTVTPR